MCQHYKKEKRDSPWLSFEVSEFKRHLEWDEKCRVGGVRTLGEGGGKDQGFYLSKKKKKKQKAGSVAQK